MIRNEEWLDKVKEAQACMKTESAKPLIEIDTKKLQRCIEILATHDIYIQRASDVLKRAQEKHDGGGGDPGQ